jgi:hypothetical protein
MLFTRRRKMPEAPRFRRIAWFQVLTGTNVVTNTDYIYKLTDGASVEKIPEVQLCVSDRPLQCHLRGR